MRVISGKFKGVSLVNLKNRAIRPTSDRAKEMIFSTLNSILLMDNKNLTDLLVLDCFCGTGALGIEAISRGAQKVIFIDSEEESLNICKRNCEKLKIMNSVEMIKLDFVNNSLSQIYSKFDLFFCDSPYGKFVASELVNKMKKITKKNSYGVLELPIQKNKLTFQGFEILKKKKFLNLTFFLSKDFNYYFLPKSFSISLSFSSIYVGLP